MPNVGETVIMSGRGGVDLGLHENDWTYRYIGAVHVSPKLRTCSAT